MVVKHYVDSMFVGELIERGLVAEKRQRRGGMGKPPTELEMSPRSAFSVGLDLDRDGLTAVLIDLAGGVLARERVAFTDLSAAAVVPRMTQATETLLSGQDDVVGTHLSTLTDTDGLAFSFTGDRLLKLGDLNLGTTGSLVLAAGPGIVDDGEGMQDASNGTGLAIVRALVRDELGGTLDRH